MILNSPLEKIIFYYFPVILFSLLPFFLITGPFLSDLSVSLIGLFFLIYCFKKKEFKNFHNNYFYFFLVFCSYLILNSLFNNFNLDSLKISFFYFRYGIFVIAISALLDFDSKFIKYFFYCILICLIFLIFDGFYQYFFYKNIFGFVSPAAHRVSSFFGNELILGSYLSKLLPIFFGISILIFRKKFFFFILILIFILSDVLIFISGDRSAFFIFNFSAIFVILFSRKLLKLRLITLIFSVLIIVIISVINPSAKERIFDQTLREMNLMKEKKTDQDKIYVFSIQHTHHFIAAYRMFLDNKFLGVGVKNFRNFCGNEKYSDGLKFSCSSHPHNSYLQILAETGTIGFLFLIIPLFYFLKYIFKHLVLKLRHKYYFSDFEICLLSGIVIYLWPFMPTGNIFNNWVNILLILNLPFLIWSRKLTKNNKLKNE
jgi:O-antigen ligase